MGEPREQIQGRVWSGQFVHQAKVAFRPLDGGLVQ
ncbi:hypothetical protein DB854_18605 [Xanthomonas perforans]|nr:hypothetical protein DB854_18605 [Xanthomonas perforans]